MSVGVLSSSPPPSPPFCFVLFLAANENTCAHNTNAKDNVQICMYTTLKERECVCVYVRACVCVREGERDRKSE